MGLKSARPSHPATPGRRSSRTPRSSVDPAAASLRSRPTVFSHPPPRACVSTGSRRSPRCPRGRERLTHRTPSRHRFSPSPTGRDPRGAEILAGPGSTSLSRGPGTPANPRPPRCSAVQPPPGLSVHRPVHPSTAIALRLQPFLRRNLPQNLSQRVGLPLQRYHESWQGLRTSTRRLPHDGPPASLPRIRSLYSEREGLLLRVSSREDLIAT